MTTRVQSPLKVLSLLVCVGAVAGCSGTRGPSGAERYAARSPAGSLAIGPIAGLKQVVVGGGANRALVISDPGGAHRGPLVIFLHGWGAPGPLLYGSWLRHLADDGATVIFPAYQVGREPPEDSPTNMERGVRATLSRLHLSPRSVVVVGHTTGAALAIDYAVDASRAGLPAACAVYGVFPGSLIGQGAEVPLSSPAKLPAATRLTLVAGSSDPVPGGWALARNLLGTATQLPASHRTLIDAPGDNPNGPIERNRAARRTYWSTLDRLIATCGSPQPRG
jgi:pimeloyl-ACP methyl ester carboxylesterase